MTHPDQLGSGELVLILLRSLENLILDLRGNGGGFLTAAYEIADHFLESGRMIVYTEGLRSSKKEYTSVPDGIFEKGKLVVLIEAIS